MEIHLAFENWDKYQSESKRVKNPSWFRFENKTFMDRVWQNLDHQSGEFSAFMFLLMFVSQSGNETGSIKTDTEILARLSGLPEPIIIKTLKKVTSIGIASCPETSGNIPTCPEKSRLQDKTRHNNTRQDKTKHISDGSATDVALVGKGRVSKKGGLGETPTKLFIATYVDTYRYFLDHRQCFIPKLIAN